MEISAEGGLGDGSRLCRHGHPRLLDTRLLGKERSLGRPYPVVCHLVDTGAYFAELWESAVGLRMRARIAGALGLSEHNAVRELAFWAALHDLGKISPSFQHSISKALGAENERSGHFEQFLADGRYQHGRGGTDNGAGPHSQIVHWTLPGMLEQLGYPPGDPDGVVGDRIPHAIGQLLGGHHGVFHPRMEPRQLKHPATFLPQAGKGAWQEQRLRHVRVLRTLITDDGPVPTGILPAELSVIVLGAVMVADWMASEKQAIEEVRQPPEDEECCCSEVLARHWSGAREKARRSLHKQALGRCGFATPTDEELVGAADFPVGSVYGPLARQMFSAAGPARAGMLLVSAPAGPERRGLGLIAASKLGRASEARGIALAVPDEHQLEAASRELASLAGMLLEGSGTLTRLHPMFFDSDPASASEKIPELSLCPQDQASAQQWLTHRRRGLLAALGVGMHAQFLPAILPVPDNAVRLFALSEKVLVVDGVQPQEPLPHQLLCLLVEWVAALGASLVLLTDTLAGASVDRLVQAYRGGARVARGDRCREEGTPPPAELPQPGWLHVDAENGAVTGAAVDLPEDSVVHVSSWHVRQCAGHSAPYVDAVVHRSGDGCSVLVCCDSVEEAQRTFSALERHRRRHAVPGELRLLHSRFPRYRVHELVAECTEAHRNPTRDGSVLVTTPSFAEHLSFGFDRVVTRVVTLPSLLARAVRGRDLVLLEGEEPTGSPMDQALRQRTLQALRTHGRQLQLPRDSAELIRRVYDSDNYLAALDDLSAMRQHRLDAAADGYEATMRYEGELIGVPSPANVHNDLYELTRAEFGLTEDHLATTVGFEQAYVLFVHLRDAYAYLDPEGKERVPFVGFGSKHDSAVAALAQYTIPVPPEWAPEGGISTQIDRERFAAIVNLKHKHWAKRTWLNRVYPVVLSGTGDSASGLLGSIRLGFTNNTGLIRLG
ncbi:CRISPR-associated endonuclease Cas3'' [Streptomyces sp. enrichment culture]|uniref:CRISPR-associated endonuclease Cas3'' n=1 Tax=Streptomyces sp. enrichment culture TaxID=1795815 RepID=UPI003F554714